MSVRNRVYHIVKTSRRKDTSYYFDLFIIIMIVLSVLEIILESEAALRAQYAPYFSTFETASLIIFTIEYFIRVWTIVEHPKYRSPFWGRLRFMVTPLAIIDLIAILPFLLPFIGVDFRFLRAFRLFRIFLIFKLIRYTKALDLMTRILWKKKEELMVTLLFLLIALVIVSTLMYYVENPAQPDVFSSISSALWWGVVTLTTVGYGDVYPITAMGKLLNGIFILIGIALIALPSGILASAYTEEMIKHRRELEEEKEKEEERKTQSNG